MANHFSKLALACGISFLAALPYSLHGGGSLSQNLDCPTSIKSGETLLCSLKVQEPFDGPAKINFMGIERLIPAGAIWLEAERLDVASQGKDPSCSNGGFAFSALPYAILLKGKAPDDGKARVLWCRVKGGALCLKTGGREIWNWQGSLDAFVWRRMGELKAGDFSIMKSESKETLSLDCAILSADLDYVPPQNLDCPPWAFKWRTDGSSAGLQKLMVGLETHGRKESAVISVDIIPQARERNALIPSLKSGASSLALLNLPLESTKPISALSWLDFSGPDFEALFRKEPLSGAFGAAPSDFIALRHSKGKNLPEKVSIPVGAKCQGLLFLQTEFWQAEHGAKICEYRVFYSDGSSIEVPIREDIEISGGARMPEPASAIYVGTLKNKECLSFHFSLLPWRNPTPGKLIEKIEFSNDMKETALDENSMIPLNVRSDACQILLGIAKLDDATLAGKLCDAIAKTESRSNADSTDGITVNLFERFSPINPGIFGTNETCSLEMHLPSLAKYRELSGALALPAIRLHGPHYLDNIFPDGPDKPNFESFDASLAALRKSNPDAEIMLCVNSIPKYVNPHTEEGRALFARLCSTLATHLKENGLQPLYWEIYNEPYFNGIDKDRSLWKMYNQTAEAIRKADPKVKIGGFAPCWPFVDMIKDFYSNCGSNIDFISWHKYLTGSASTSDEYVMSGTASYGDDFARIRKALRSVGAPDSLKLALTEYNINWNWKPHDPRQADYRGSAWTASLLNHLIRNQADLAMSWHARGGGTFGLIDDSDNLRPTAFLLQLLAENMKGRYCLSNSSNPSLECLSFVGEKAFGLLLINKADAKRNVRVNVLNAPVFAHKPVSGDSWTYSIGSYGVKREFSPSWIGESLSETLGLEPFEVKLIVVPIESGREVR